MNVTSESCRHKNYISGCIVSPNDDVETFWSNLYYALVGDGELIKIISFIILSPAYATNGLVCGILVPAYACVSNNSKITP